MLEGHSGSGGQAHATNQQMELAAVLRALEHLTPTGRPITVVSDSAYVVNCFERRWYDNWNRRDWRNVKNQELWRPLVELALAHDVRFQKVKGHSGDPGNELANRLATAAAAEANRVPPTCRNTRFAHRNPGRSMSSPNQRHGTTKKGTRCRAGAQRGSEYCPHHQPTS